MPRQLPWQVELNQEKTAAAPNSVPSASSPSARAAQASSKAKLKLSTSVDGVNISPSNTAQGLGTSRRPHLPRSPSTSPPPEPLREEFMIEGPRYDDRYRMVEDEFLAVAGEFTRHLHAAEYQRLRNLASSKNAETIDNISLPVTGAPTDAVRRRYARLETAARQQRGLSKVLGKRVDHTSDSEDKPWTGTSLQGLMDSPRKKKAPLNRSLSALSGLAGFRAARRSTPSLDRAVHMQGRLGNRRPLSEDEGDDNEDDDSALDGHTSWSPKLHRARVTEMPSVLMLPARNTTESRPLQTSAHASCASRDQSTRSDRFSPLNAPSHEQTSRLNKTHVASSQDEEEDDLDLFSRVRSRRAAQRRRPRSPVITWEANAEDSQSATSLHEIPFL